MGWALGHAALEHDAGDRRGTASQQWDAIGIEGVVRSMRFNRRVVGDTVVVTTRLVP